MYGQDLRNILFSDAEINSASYYGIRKILELILCNPHIINGANRFLSEYINSLLPKIARPPTPSESQSILDLFHKRFIYPDFFSGIIRVFCETPLGKILLTAASTTGETELLEYFASL